MAFKAGSINWFYLFVLRGKKEGGTAAQVKASKGKGKRSPDQVSPPGPELCPSGSLVPLVVLSQAVQTQPPDKYKYKNICKYSDSLVVQEFLRDAFQSQLGVARTCWLEKWNQDVCICKYSGIHAVTVLAIGKWEGILVTALLQIRGFSALTRVLDEWLYLTDVNWTKTLRRNLLLILGCILIVSLILDSGCILQTIVVSGVEVEPCEETSSP